MRPDIVDPGIITVLTGETQHLIDLPDGDCQVDYDIRADGECKLYWIVADDGVLIPEALGAFLKGRRRVRHLKGMAVRCSKSTRVGITVYHQQVQIVDPLNDEPVEIITPEMPPMSLAQMVGGLVAQELASRGVDDDQLDPEDIIEDMIESMPDDIDPEFGPGNMELDDEMENKVRKKEKKVRPSDDDGPADGSDDDTSGVSSDAPEPGQGDGTGGDGESSGVQGTDGGANEKKDD